MFTVWTTTASNCHNYYVVSATGKNKNRGSPHSCLSFLLTAWILHSTLKIKKLNKYESIILSKCNWIYTKKDLLD